MIVRDRSNFINIKYQINSQFEKQLAKQTTLFRESISRLVFNVVDAQCHHVGWQFFLATVEVAFLPPAVVACENQCLLGDGRDSEIEYLTSCFH